MLNGVHSSLTGPDPHRIVHLANEDFPVAFLSASGGPHYGIHHFNRIFLQHNHLHLHLGKELDAVLGSRTAGPQSPPGTAGTRKG